jgi:propanol-preferring alcohol dehydrogenase
MALAAAVTNRGSAVVVAGLGGGTLTFEASPVSDLFPEVALRRVAAGNRRELREVVELARKGTLRAETVTHPLSSAGEVIDRIDAGGITGRAVLTPPGAKTRHEATEERG